MEEHMLVAALIVKRRLKMPRENISGQVGKMIKPEGEVPYPKIQISLVMTKTGLWGLHCEGKDQLRWGHLTDPTPQIKYSGSHPIKQNLRNKISKSFTNFRIAEPCRGRTWRVVRATLEVSFKVPMIWKIFSAYLKGLSKYRRMAFFFLKYLFSF